MNVCGNSFREALENEFGAASGKVVDDALDVKYSLDDMLKIIAIHLRFTDDPLVDIDAFVADGHRLGLKRIMKRLKLIKNEMEKAD